MDPSSSFAAVEITAEAFLIQGVGPVIVGVIVDGELRTGMSVNTGLQPDRLTIAQICPMRIGSPPKPWVGLLFKEPLGLEFVRQAFPVGAVLEIV